MLHKAMAVSTKIKKLCAAPVQQHEQRRSCLKVREEGLSNTRRLISILFVTIEVPLHKALKFHCTVEQIALYSLLSCYVCSH